MCTMRRHPSLSAAMSRNALQVPRVAERMAELRQVLLQRVGEAPSWSASHTSSRGEVGVHGHLRRGPRVKSEYMTEKAQPALRHV